MLGSWVESVSEILKRNLRQSSLIQVPKKILFNGYIHESVVKEFYLAMSCAWPWAAEN